MYWLPYSSHTSHYPSQPFCLPWISYATQKLMFNLCKMLQKQSEAFYTFLRHFFPSLNQNFIAYRSSKVSSRPDCIFEIHHLWQPGFSRVYSICCCSSSFKAEIIKIGQSSHKMDSNNILNSQESTAILNAFTKKSLETYWMYHINILTTSAKFEPFHLPITKLKWLIIATISSSHFRDASTWKLNHQKELISYKTLQCTNSK